MVKRSIKAILKVKLTTAKKGLALARGQQYGQIRKSQPTRPTHLHIIALFKCPKQTVDALRTRQLYGEFLGHAMTKNTREFLAKLRGGLVSLPAICEFPFASLHRLKVFDGKPHQRWRFGKKIFSGGPRCKVIGYPVPIFLQSSSKTLLSIQVQSPVGDHVRQRCLLFSPWVAGRPNQRRLPPPTGGGHTQKQLVAVLEVLFK